MTRRLEELNSYAQEVNEKQQATSELYGMTMAETKLSELVPGLSDHELLSDSGSQVIDIDP